jgi:hypothetical protein
MWTRALIGLVLVLSVVTGSIPPAIAQTPDPSFDEPTPPRLGVVEGQASFWRPGAPDWVRAQVNTPLAPGDELATGAPGSLEIQIGAMAFVRAAASTQLGLANQERDFVQFTVTGGEVAFDLHALEPGGAVEVDTPGGAFTIDHAGYYRVAVSGPQTSFTVRRGGRATLVPASEPPMTVRSGDAVVIDGGAGGRIGFSQARPLDDWDRWNYTRTATLLDAASARHVSAGMYGLGELDAHGQWRTVPTYGNVWVPTGVSSGWAPYSTGAWIMDPAYGWTWVDTASWGWAPYHYGRWVFLDGVWAWAPGPALARPVYTPALVAFFGEPGVSVTPVVGWVALGWGEPCVPWWGRSGFAHRPSWRGWGGPRVVSSVTNVMVYRNAAVQNAVVAVDSKRFGHGQLTTTRVPPMEVKRLQPMQGGLPVTVTPASYVPTVSGGVRPPEGTLRREVVAIRSPRAGKGSEAASAPGAGPGGIVKAPPRLVSGAPTSGTPVREPAPVEELRPRASRPLGGGGAVREPGAIESSPAPRPAPGRPAVLPPMSGRPTPPMSSEAPGQSSRPSGGAGTVREPGAIESSPAPRPAPGRPAVLPPMSGRPTPPMSSEAPGQPSRPSGGAGTVREPGPIEASPAPRPAPGRPAVLPPVSGRPTPVTPPEARPVETPTPIAPGRGGATLATPPAPSRRAETPAPMPPVKGGPSLATSPTPGRPMEPRRLETPTPASLVKGQPAPVTPIPGRPETPAGKGPALVSPSPPARPLEARPASNGSPVVMQPAPGRRVESAPPTAAGRASAGQPASRPSPIDEGAGRPDRNRG